MVVTWWGTFVSLINLLVPRLEDKLQDRLIIGAFIIEFYELSSSNSGDQTVALPNKFRSKFPIP